MTVSIVIRAYNEAAHLEKLLVGIRAQRLAPHEIILVDSGSTDETVALAERFGVKVMHISKHDFTFGRALNHGCAAATGEVLVFVSAHVYPTHDDWLERLVVPFAEPKVVLSYGMQRGGEVNKFSEHQIFRKWFPVEPALPQSGYFCNNANCAVRRSVWAHQPYDEGLTGLEDLAWAKAAQEAGGWLAYVPEAQIIHVHDESWPQVQSRYRREALALRHIDGHAHFSGWDFVRLLFGNVLADSRRALREGALAREFGSILRFRYRQFLGTWQGHIGPPEVSVALRQRFYYPAADEHDGETALPDRRAIDYDRLMRAAPGSPLTLVADNSAPGPASGRLRAR